MWRGGCIIRSAFLGKIKEAFDRNPKLTNLLLDPYFRERARALPARLAAGCARGDRPRHPRAGDDARPWPTSTATAANRCRPTCSRPSATTSAPITYERVDRPRGQFFHTNWTGRGGTTASTSYNV